MQIHWLKRQGNTRLTVIVMGWACDAEPVRHLDAEGRDMLCIYDYADFDTLDPRVISELSGISTKYEQRSLVAWSFGVWVSERLFGPQGLCPVTFARATALNGTPFPADDALGIGLRRLLVTIRGLGKGGKETFDRKTYGRWYETMQGKLSPRGIDDNIRELEVLMELSAQPYAPSLAWDSAIVGTEDEIFPPENMLRYWADRAKTVPLPHYPFGDAALIKDLF